MNNTIDDPVVEEIRAVRRELAERFGDDVDALCDFLAQQEKQHENRLVNRAPKAPQYTQVVATARKKSTG
jgi:DNA-binding ferritin-like protein (Dps family)